MKTRHVTHEPEAAFDRLLEAHLASPEERLIPSSGFAASVMESIHQEAVEPPPIPFPWRRVVPGGVSILFTLVAFVLLAPGRLNFSVGSGSDWLTALSSIPSGEVVLGSILLASCVSAAAVAASFRLAGGNR